MSNTDGWYERKGFRFDREGGCISFILLDTPMHDRQIQLITEQLNDQLGEGHGIEEFVYRNILEEIQYDGWGNIRLVWNRAVCDWLKDEQLEHMQEIVVEAFNQTQWGENWITLHRYDDDGFQDWDDVEIYVEATRENGYAISWDDVRQLVPDELVDQFDAYKTVELLKEAA